MLDRRKTLAFGLVLSPSGVVSRMRYASRQLLGKCAEESYPVTVVDGLCRRLRTKGVASVIADHGHMP